MHNQRRQLPSGCTGKQRYDGKWDAMQAVARQRNMKSSIQGRLCAYPCRFCGGWHVGHMFTEARGGT